jgi:hypothetical protein
METEKSLPGESRGASGRKWRPWHERETAVRIRGEAGERGILVTIDSRALSTSLQLIYPAEIWQRYPQENRSHLVDSITYIFTAHLPFLLKGNIRLEYSTGFPSAYSWAIHSFTRFLPSYWYLYRRKRGSKVFPMLKTLLNSRAVFSEMEEKYPVFPPSRPDRAVIPFTFGKDSFLSYTIASRLGIETVLVYFNEPTERYARAHKLELIERFCSDRDAEVYYIENPLGELRQYGEAWFGWELAITSWAVMALPFAYAAEARYILFSNEKSCNDFFYDREGLKVIPEFDQSAPATDALNALVQSMSQGQVYVATFLQGLNELAVIAMLKYLDRSVCSYLMSCWAETDKALHKRWCAACSKCARIYLYLSANGIDPEAEAGYEDNLLENGYEHLYNVFGEAQGTGFDAFGTNREEQTFAFYLAWLQGRSDPLIEKFLASPLFGEVTEKFDAYLKEYYGLHPEQLSPPRYKERIDALYREGLAEARRELIHLREEKERGVYKETQ